jgi:CPA2 family monovalent cation:H+ antiporter-2
MEAPPDFSAFKVALIVLGAAAIVIPLFHRMRVSTVLGFMLVGAAVGPYGLGQATRAVPVLTAVTITDPAAIAPIARLGVVLLLFMIGLELSLERLLVMRGLVFGLGALQLGLSAAALAGAAVVAGSDATAAVVLGLAGAMSSTAVTLQVLSQAKRLATPVGRSCFAILLFQDLAVVPVLFTLVLLQHGTQAVNIATVAGAIGKAVLALLSIIGIGRLALRPLFRGVARTNSPELFTAACLLVVFATALATAAAGLSMALGALISGLLLAGTEYRHQVEVTIEPFKGLLVGVFLISVGMGLDLGKLVAEPGAVLGLAAGLVGLKFVVIATLARLWGFAWPIGIQIGLLLGPAGEFGFVILAIAVGEGLLDPAAAEITLTAAALSMALIPLFAGLGRRFAPPGGVSVDPALLPPVDGKSATRVIIAGFGRVGQTVAAMLERHKISYLAIDRNADLVARERAAGRWVFYGDLARVELLRALDVGGARALVVTMDDRRTVDAVVEAARAERKPLLIVARARDASHAAHLYRIGASDAIPETIEASLQLAEAVLVDIGVPMGPVIASIHEKRAELQEQIKAMAPGVEIRQRGRRMRRG